jgi:hypothetical protein
LGWAKEKKRKRGVVFDGKENETINLDKCVGMSESGERKE